MRESARRKRKFVLLPELSLSPSLSLGLVCFTSCLPLVEIHLFGENVPGFSSLLFLYFFLFLFHKFESIQSLSCLSANCDFILSDFQVYLNFPSTTTTTATMC